MNYGIKGDYTSLSEVEEKPRNPFVNYLVFNEKFVLKRLKDDEITKQLKEENKELKEVGLEIGKRKRVRTAPFTQLYWEKPIDYRNLSPSALRIVFYILYEKLEYGRDTVMIAPKHLMDELGLSKSSVNSSLLELINKKVLDIRIANIWWINPANFYCGDRMNIKTK